jgi:hypothetical protein
MMASDEKGVLQGGNLCKNLIALGVRAVKTSS